MGGGTKKYFGGTVFAARRLVEKTFSWKRDSGDRFGARLVRGTKRGREKGGCTDVGKERRKQKEKIKPQGQEKIRGAMTEWDYEAKGIFNVEAKVVTGVKTEGGSCRWGSRSK